MLCELVIIAEKFHTPFLRRNVEINPSLSSSIFREGHDRAIGAAPIEFNLIMGFWYWLNFTEGQCLLSCKSFGGKFLYDADNEGQNMACFNWGWRITAP